MTEWLMSFGHWGFIVPSYVVFALALVIDSVNAQSLKKRLRQQLSARHARQSEQQS